MTSFLGPNTGGVLHPSGAQRHPTSDPPSVPPAALARRDAMVAGVRNDCTGWAFWAAAGGTRRRPLVQLGARYG
jgi:hypothetical protein